MVTDGVGAVEEVLHPGEKGAIRWLRVGSGRLALWHKPGKKACPKLKAVAGATHLLTLLAAREDAAKVGEHAAAAALEWHWHPLDGADEAYLQTAAAVDVLRAATADARALLGEANSVLVHCSAGVHRTGSLAYAVLRSLGWSRSAALAGLNDAARHGRRRGRRGEGQQRRRRESHAHRRAPRGSGAAGGGRTRREQHYKEEEEEEEEEEEARRTKTRRRRGQQQHQHQHQQQKRQRQHHHHHQQKRQRQRQ